MAVTPQSVGGRNAAHGATQPDEPNSSGKPVVPEHGFRAAERRFAGTDGGETERTEGSSLLFRPERARWL